MVSWKIVSVLTKFWESSPGKFDLFFWYFFLLENLMCSNEILDNISWKIWSVLIIFFPPGKSYVFLAEFWESSPGNFDVFFQPAKLRKKQYEGVFFDYIASHIECRIQQKLPPPVLVFSDFACVLVPFLVLLEILMCSYKRIMSSPGKICSCYIQAFWKIWCVLEISLNKLLPGKKNRYFS